MLVSFQDGNVGVCSASERHREPAVATCAFPRNESRAWANASARSTGSLGGRVSLDWSLRPGCAPEIASAPGKSHVAARLRRPVTLAPPASVYKRPRAQRSRCVMQTRPGFSHCRSSSADQIGLPGHSPDRARIASTPGARGKSEVDPTAVNRILHQRMVKLQLRPSDARRSRGRADSKDTPACPQNLTPPPYLATSRR